MSLEEKGFETRIVVPNYRGKGTMHIATITNKSSDENLTSSALVEQFDKIFKLDKKASSRTGGHTARYRTSLKYLQKNKDTYNIETVKRGSLETAYFNLAKAARRTQDLKIKGKDNRMFRLARNNALIPIPNGNTVQYYNLSTLGDLKEAYLFEHMNNADSANMTSLLETALKVNN
jgi:hypothetical protein